MKHLTDPILFVVLAAIWLLIVCPAQALNSTSDQIAWRDAAGASLGDVVVIEFALPVGTVLDAQYPSVHWPDGGEVCSTGLLNGRCAWKPSSLELAVEFDPPVIGAGAVYGEDTQPRLRAYIDPMDPLPAESSPTYGLAFPGQTRFLGASGTTPFARIEFESLVTAMKVVTLMIIPDPGQPLRVCTQGASYSLFFASVLDGAGQWGPWQGGEPDGQCWTFEAVPPGAVWQSYGVGQSAQP